MKITTLQEFNELQKKQKAALKRDDEDFFEPSFAHPGESSLLGFYENKYLVAFNSEEKILLISIKDLLDKEYLEKKDVKGFFLNDPYFTYINGGFESSMRYGKFIDKEKGRVFAFEKSLRKPKAESSENSYLEKNHRHMESLKQEFIKRNKESPFPISAMASMLLGIDDIDDDSEDLDGSLWGKTTEQKQKIIKNRVKEFTQDVLSRPRVLLNSDLTLETVLALGNYQIWSRSFDRDEIGIVNHQLNFKNIKEELNAITQYLYVNDKSPENRSQYVKQIFKEDNSKAGLDIDPTILSAIEALQKHKEDVRNEKLRVYNEKAESFSKKNKVINQFLKADQETIKETFNRFIGKEKKEKKKEKKEKMRNEFFNVSDLFIMPKLKTIRDEYGEDVVQEEEIIFQDSLDVSLNMKDSYQADKYAQSFIFFYTKENDIVVKTKKSVMNSYINKDKTFFDNIVGAIDVIFIIGKEQEEFLTLIKKDNKELIEQEVKFNDIKEMIPILENFKIEISDFSKENIMTLNVLNSVDMYQRVQSVDYIVNNNGNVEYKNDLRMINYNLFMNDPDESKSLTYLEEVKKINDPAFVMKRSAKQEELMLKHREHLALLKENKRLEEEKEMLLKREKEDALFKKREAKEDAKKALADEFKNAVRKINPK